MFTIEELQTIDRKYFMVIVEDTYDVTLISNNTKHIWYIHNVELAKRNLWSIINTISTIHIVTFPDAVR